MENFSTVLRNSVGVLSMAFSLIIPLMYYFHPKTRQHPNIILVMICLVEFQITFKGLVFYCTPLLCEYSSRISNFYLIHHRNCQGFQFLFFKCLVFFQLNLYLAWCVDLMLTLRRPLSKTKFRILFYLPLTIIMVYVQCFGQDDQVNMMICKNIFLAIVLLQYLVFVASVLICLLALYKAKKIKNKLIRDIKMKFLKQQAFSLILVVIVCNFYTIQLFPQSQFQNGQYTFIKKVQFWLNTEYQFTSYFIFTQGITLGLIRLQEKYFREQLFKSACYILRTKYNINISEIDQPDQFQNVPLSILIKTIQSQQVMNGILEGIINSIQSYEIMNDNNIRISKSKGQIKDYMNPKKGQIQTHDLTEMFILKDETIEIEVVGYEPGIFAQLRDIDSISISDIEESLSVFNNSTVIDQMSESMGKSGAIFFRSYNKKFLIKTLTKNELDFLIKILPNYDSYIKENQNSLIARIYGCYAIQIENISPVYLILMEYTFERINEPFQSYDIKGSLIGRRTNSHIFGKDSDFLEQQELINLNMKFRKLLINQVKKDSKFLKGLNIMDYSLLIGISEEESIVLPQGKNHFYHTARLCSDHLSSKIYSVSIIDFLQSYDTEKLIENRYKSIFNKERLISSVAPNLYSKRFIAFLNSIICTSKQY